MKDLFSFNLPVIVKALRPLVICLFSPMKRNLLFFVAVFASKTNFVGFVFPELNLISPSTTNVFPFEETSVVLYDLTFS